MQYVTSLEEAFQKNNREWPLFLKKMKSPAGRKKMASLVELRSQVNAVYYTCIENNIIKAKNCFYQAAIAERFLYERHTGDVFEVSKSILYPILSDNADLINCYLDYDRSRFKEAGTFTYHFVKAVQASLKDDEKDLAFRIDRLRLRTRYGTAQLMAGSVAFFEGLRDKDSSKIKAGVLSVQKLKQPWQMSPVRGHMCIQATGLAKLAWRKGFEIDFDSPFIPNGLLPINQASYYRCFNFFGGYEQR